MEISRLCVGRAVLGDKGYFAGDILSRSGGIGEDSVVLEGCFCVMWDVWWELVFCFVGG